MNQTLIDAREQASDDLTAIRGIGEAIAYWLEEAFNVRTYQDLAQLSAHDIEAQMKEDGKIASSRKIESWLAQAKALAAINDPVLPETAKAEGDEWKTMATFVVVFETRDESGQKIVRTKAHHMEVDDTAIWPSAAHVSLPQWMLKQLGPNVSEYLENVPQIESQPSELMSYTSSEVLNKPYSEKLQRYISKAQSFTTQAPTEQTTLIRAMDESSHAKTVSSPYSSRLQHTIAKADALAARVRKP